uniref:NADH-ubiquinone oxidoreductase chain 1 n=1 Tax=Neomazocraes dorosomatis TaxID=1131909 RepID=A0A3G0WUL3_9PLAT|nr:NADH dehydrogenase subunit 1 [Neomazocraes dorosomatis]
MNLFNQCDFLLNAEACVYYIFLIILFLIFFILVFFFVLIERKILGVCQSRLGPNKVSFIGVLQSLADFIKLGGKINLTFGSSSNFNYRGLFYMLGILYFLLGALIFINFFLNSLINGSMGGVFVCWLIVISSLSGYGFILCGWGSSSKYSLFGSMRSSFSGITFEGCLMCIVLTLGLLNSGYNFFYFNNNYDFFLIFSCFFIYILSIISFLCECNRSPFDFSESESDLVSGFNTDYYGLGFAILFACEYAIMVFFSWLLGFLFFSNIFNTLMMFFHSFLLIFVRACFPRFRYDYFVSFFWKNVFIIFFLFILGLI